MAQESDPRLITCLLCLSLLLPACLASTCKFEEPTILSGEQAELVDKSLLTGEPCSPPCWQGITPEITSKTEALEILNELEFIDPESIKIREGLGLVWESVFNKGQDSHRDGEIRFDERGIITSILVRELWYQLTLQELIDVKGEPDGVRIVRTRHPDGGYFDCMGVNVVWFEEGLEVYVASVPTSTTPSSVVVKPDQRISGVHYFPSVSNLEEYTTNPGSFYYPDLDFFVAWEEFR